MVRIGARVAPLLAILLLVTGFSGCVGLFGGGATLTVEEPREWTLSTVQHDGWTREPLWVESSIDGARLKVDVYRPEGAGPFPVILIQSPYWSFLGDRKTTLAPTWEVEYFAPRGYAVALGEMRGTRESHGCWDFGGRLDQTDGHDIVEALAAMPWSNGRVGMIGGSHVGMSQIAAAITDPPSLKAIVPIVAVTDWYRYLHKDGAPYVLNRATPPAYFAVHASPPTESLVSPDTVLTLARTVCSENAVHLAKSTELHGDKDAYWQERDLIARAGDIRAAVYVVNGLKDENVKADHFLDFWEALPEDIPKKLWIGQFGHQLPLYREWRDDVHRWFDHFLRDEENHILSDPAVTVQDNLGLTRWEAGWPGDAMRYERWMITHWLEPEEGSVLRAESTYRSFPLSDRGVETWNSARIEFPSAPLAADLHLAGAARLELEMTLDADKGRLIAVLYDEAPDGARDEITRAYMEARHREGLEKGTPVPVDVPQSYNLSFYPRDHVVKAGHTVVLAFLGGDMGCLAAGFLVPLVPPAECEGTGIVGHETIIHHLLHHGPGSGTRLVLPVLTMAGGERVVEPLDAILDDPPQ
jgi:X-Pro dipeptidyl-peptidase